MFRALKALGIEETHPIVGTVLAMRNGQTASEIKPGSARWRNAAFVLGKMAMTAGNVTAEDVKAWLAAILACTKAGNMTDEDIKNRIAGIAFALEGVPKVLLSSACQRDVIRSCEWFPTAAEIWLCIQPALEEYNLLRHEMNVILGRHYAAALPSPEEVLAEGWLVETEKVTRLVPLSRPAEAAR
jgi:hypothetical protein